MNKASHIAIIMDGNGRWAKQRGEKRTFGHEAGARVAREITIFCANSKEIQRLTLYAFSTENWKRPKLEVEFLMKLMKKYLLGELESYLANNIKFEVIGDTSAFSASLRETIEMVRSKTAHCDGLVHSLALNYGSQDEIIRAINSIKKEDNGIITKELFESFLDINHSVDMLIRTGGDRRLSNFLLWQAAYAELFFTDTLWPDFTTSELEAIIKEFSKVERRFGGLK